MLPIPFAKYLPRVFSRDNAAVALSNKIDQWVTTWKNDAMSLGVCMDPSRASDGLLDEIGALVAADLRNIDTSVTKRKKISSAVRGQRYRGTWSDDVKKRIDAITGRNDSRIIRVVGTDELVLMEENYPPSFYWASLGADGIDNNLGPFPLSESSSVENAGNILIDLIDLMTPEVIKQIKEDLTADVLPAYFVIYLGYTGGGTNYVLQPDGVI